MQSIEAIDGRYDRLARIEPWSRWGAKWIDTAIFAVAFSLLFTALGYDWYAEYSGLFFFMFMAFAYPFWDGFLVALSGGSPGRAVFRFRVNLRGTSAAPSLGKAVSRAWGAWSGGCALGIPIIFIFTGFASKGDLEKNGESAWDRECKTEVVHQGSAWWSWCVLVAVMLALFALNTYGQENYY